MKAKLNLFCLRRLFVPSLAIVACGLFLTLVQCSDSESPALPALIEIISGDNQYSLHGTQLPNQMIVRARDVNGSPSADAGITFSMVQGNGTLSKSTARTNIDGLASVTLTLSPENGTNVVRAALEANTGEFVLFTATSADYFCREAELTKSVTYGSSGNLFLATFKSEIYSETATNGGIVQVSPLGSVTGFREFPTAETNFITVIWDIAFSPRGDLFFSNSSDQDWLVKVGTDGSVTGFGFLEDPNGAELATFPAGLVAGCDRLGPFVLQCDHSFVRFTGAYYPSGGINNDAFAVNQTTHDIYYIDNSDSTVYCLPLDSLTIEGPVEPVAYLTTDEALGARGMVCDDSGMLYLLVDTDTTKELLEIDPLAGPASSTSVLFDFFSRGAGDLAGRQRDLAFDPAWNRLYTIDTLNNSLMAMDLNNPTLFVEIETLKNNTDISTDDYSGERVGLAVLP
jgi:hypothetical protein